MVLDLKEIFVNQGSRLEVSCPEDVILPYLPYDRVSNVKVDAVVENSADIVTLRLDVSFKYDTSCDRCMDDLHLDYKNSFLHTVVTHLEADEGDYIKASNYRLDIDEVVKDDVLLDMPSKVLCREDCKGICQKCGANLNNSQCNCKAHEVDPRLEVLKKFIDTNLD